MTKEDHPTTAPPFRIADWPLHAMAEIVSEAQARIVAALSPPGMTATVWRVLAVLAEAPGSTTKDIAIRAVLERPALSRVLEKLEQAGLVERRPNEKDARSTLLTLSDKGLDVYGRVSAVAGVELQSVFQTLNGSERAELQRLLDKVLAGLV